MANTNMLTAAASDTITIDHSVTALEPLESNISTIVQEALTAVAGAKNAVGKTPEIYHRFSESTDTIQKQQFREELISACSTMSHLSKIISRLKFLQTDLAPKELDIEKIRSNARTLYRTGLDKGSPWLPIKVACAKNYLGDLKSDLPKIIGDDGGRPWGSPTSIEQSLTLSHETAASLRSLVVLIERTLGISHSSTPFTRGGSSQYTAAGSKRTRESVEHNTGGQGSKRRHIG